MGEQGMVSEHIVDVALAAYIDGTKRSSAPLRKGIVAALTAAMPLIVEAHLAAQPGPVQSCEWRDMPLDTPPLGDEDVEVLMGGILESMYGESRTGRYMASVLLSHPQVKQRFSFAQPGPREVVMPDTQGLFAIFREAYKATAIDPKMDRIFDDDYDWAVALCDMAGVEAVIATLAQEQEPA